MGGGGDSDMLLVLLAFRHVYWASATSMSPIRTQQRKKNSYIGLRVEVGCKEKSGVVGRHKFFWGCMESKMLLGCMEVSMLKNV